eukprot:COSAG05_NODE_6220_length_996_cov_1.771460_2_plen_160_part_00
MAPIALAGHTSFALVELVGAGFIVTEIRRHLLRCSSASAYYENLCQFYNRLRARGYPQRFLKSVFERRPSFNARKALLFREATNPTAVSAPSVLVLPFASGAEDALRGVLNSAAWMLPQYLSQRRRLVAWKAAPKIGNLTFVLGKRADDALDSMTWSGR